MKRALLVTTGTVVGVASVLAYHPDSAVLGLVPGAEALTTGTGASTQSATPEAPSSNGSATSASASAAPANASAAGGSSDASPSAAPSTKSGSTSRAAAGTAGGATATASASAAPSPTASASPSATATPSTSASAAGVADGTHTGASTIVESHGRTYGSLVATVTVSGGKMTALSFQQDPAGRNQQFIDAVNTYLVPEILRTQNVTVGIVSGATGTSMALIGSLQSALGTA